MMFIGYFNNKMLCTIFLLLVSLIRGADSFRITQIGIGGVWGKLGSPIKLDTAVVLKCVASDSYEYCTWSHRRGKCTFEWTRIAIIQTCDGISRMKLFGNYKNHDCSIILSRVNAFDEGEWECKIESYKLGPFKGEIATAKLNLTVDHTDSNGELIIGVF